MTLIFPHQEIDRRDRKIARLEAENTILRTALGEIANSQTDWAAIDDAVTKIEKAFRTRARQAIKAANQRRTDNA